MSIYSSIKFYIIVFFTGIIVLPATGAVGIALMFGGIICVIGSFLKLFSIIFGFSFPISLFEVGTFNLPIGLSFILAIILGVALYIIGKYLFKLTQRYISWIVSLKLKML